MSLEAMAYVKTLEITKPAQKLVMLLVADRVSNETGECFPGQQRLAKEASMSERTVRRHIKALTDAGMLASRKRFCPNGNPNTSAYEIVGFLDWLNCTEKCANDQRSAATTGQERPAVNSGSTTGQNVQSPPDNVVRLTQRDNPQEPKEGANIVCADDARAFALEAPEPEKRDKRKPKKRKKAKPAYTESFERFWKPYPHKVGKARAAELWAELDEEDREAAIASVPLYVEDCKKVDRQYKQGDTYLSARRWDDYEDKLKRSDEPDEESMVKLVVNYGKDQTSWGPRLQEKFGPPPGDKRCKLPQRIIDRAREILRAEKSNGNMAYA